MTGTRARGFVIGALALGFLVRGVALVVAHPSRSTFEDYEDETGVMVFALGVILAVWAFRLLRSGRAR